MNEIEEDAKAIAEQSKKLTKIMENINKSLFEQIDKLNLNSGQKLLSYGIVLEELMKAYDENLRRHSNIRINKNKDLPFTKENIMGMIFLKGLVDIQDKKRLNMEK